MKKNIHIFADETNPAAVRYSARLGRELEKAGYCIASVPDKDTEVTAVLGGDHTMQKAMKGHLNHAKVPLLGLNFGHKGFMMNDPQPPREVARRIRKSLYITQEFPLMAIMSMDSKLFIAYALNDFYINRVGAQGCKLRVTVNNVTVADRIVGDGIVVSTALGSAAYNLAAGGAAIYPTLKVISVAPIIMHSPIQIKPMVFPFPSNIVIEVLNLKKGDVRLFYDGFRLPYFSPIHILGGTLMAGLAFWKNEDFTRRIIEKIMRIPE